MAFFRSRFAKTSQGQDATTSSTSRTATMTSTPLSRNSSSASFVSTSSYVSDPGTKLCIAIIGSGLTGLSASYLLLCPDKDELPGARSSRIIEVHLFERAKKIGLDSNSITINTVSPTAASVTQPTSLRIDVPMRSLNAGYYPNVMALYSRLGIPLSKSDFTYSFATLYTSATASTDQLNSLHSPAPSDSPRHQAPSPSILYQGSSGFKGFGLPHALRTIPQIRTCSPGSRSASLKRKDLVSSMWYTIPFYFVSLFSNALAISSYLYSIIFFLIGYLGLVTEALWHHYSGNTRDPRHPLASTTLQSHFASASNPHTSGFINEVVVPLFSALMTVQASSVLSTPIAEILDYVALTFGRSHYTVASGVHEVESALSAPMAKENVHVDCEVTGLVRHRDRVDVEVLEGGEEAVYEGFHHVILATQASQSAAFIASYLQSLNPDSAVEIQETQRLQKMLRQLHQFTSEDSEVINHTDRSLLPRDESDWRDLNLVTPARPSVASADSIAESSSGRDKGVVSAAAEHGIVSADASASTASLALLSPSTSGLSSLSADTHTMASHILHQIRPRPSEFSSASSTVSSKGVLIQTTNPLLSLRPAKDKIVSSSRFERANLTLRSKAGQAGLYEWRRRGRRQHQSGDSFSRSQGLVSMPAAAVCLLSKSWSDGLLTTLCRTLHSHLPVSRWELCLGDLQGRGDGGKGKCGKAVHTDNDMRDVNGLGDNEAQVSFTSSPSSGPGIWVCGSWSPGIPLLEGCVVSSKLVVDALLRDESNRAPSAQASLVKI